MDWSKISDKSIQEFKKQVVDDMLSKGYSKDELDRVYEAVMALLEPMFDQALEEYYDQ